MTKRKKVWLILSLLMVPLIGGGFQWLRWWWNYGYSRGTRTGVLRKLSIKGSPLCKFVSGELALAGQGPGQTQDIWQFTLDDTNESNPLFVKLRTAERGAKPVTIDYRQDRGNTAKASQMFCPKTGEDAPPEYYATGVQ
ncbi:MAG TPA: hypothetical protein VH877_08505 [Polyangia bacterium]|jgi:hypothetical protein|nr:hypothetical protein [Polyangia bacterium]